MRTRFKGLWYWLSSSLILLVLVLGCEHDPDLTPIDNGGNSGGNSGGGNSGGGSNPGPDPKPCDPDSIYFETQILPIFVSNCAIPGCHDRATAQDGVILTDYDNIMEEVTPFDLDASDAYERLIDEDPEDLMPRNPNTMMGEALDQEQINLIEEWILQGAPNNGCDTCDSTDFSFSGKVSLIIQANCATSISCHGAGSANDYTTYQGLKEKVDNGTFELRVLRNLNMPPAAPLPECDRIILQKWLDSGAPNN